MPTACLTEPHALANRQPVFTTAQALFFVSHLPCLCDRPPAPRRQGPNQALQQRLRYAPAVGRCPAASLPPRSNRRLAGCPGSRLCSAQHAPAQGQRVLPDPRGTQQRDRRDGGPGCQPRQRPKARPVAAAADCQLAAQGRQPMALGPAARLGPLRLHRLQPRAPSLPAAHPDTGAGQRHPAPGRRPHGGAPPQPRRPTGDSGPGEQLAGEPHRGGRGIQRRAAWLPARAAAGSL
jgi:hypothetical protein